MRRILRLSVLTILPLLVLWSLAPAWTLSAFRTTGAARRDRSARPRSGANTVSLERETPLVQPGESMALAIPAGFNRLQPTSVEVRSGCLAYDFGLYPDGTLTAGEELLLYRGQSLTLVDVSPPALRDDDLQEEVHAKFWNRGDMGCTFQLLITGSGF
ncbi:MAG TPA: hypothetical protein VFB95_07750 [Candidatus Cryosericum sp.]|nr:hypothetical protein [Candidatus Cryosericum sp.]